MLLIISLCTTASIPSVYHAWAGADGLTAGALRGALSDAGWDVTPERSRLLLGTRTSLDLDAFDHLVRTHPGAWPARLWLTLGKGPRDARRGFAKFGRAGTRSVPRLAHYVVGTSSLLVGTADMVQYVSAAGVPHVDPATAVAHGTLHTAAAVLSLPRFQTKWDPAKPWRLWMPTARDAAMWPSFVLCLWYQAALQSDLVQCSNSAPVCMSDVELLTHVAAFCAVYSTLRGLEEDLEEGTFVQTLMSGAVITVLGVADYARALRVTSSGSLRSSAYDALLHAYPAFGDVQVAMFLGAMYLGNVVCAMSSAEHYGAVTRKQTQATALLLTALYGIPPAVACLRMGVAGPLWEVLTAQ